MNALRRLVGVLVLLLSAAGIVGCAAGIVAIWTYRPVVIRGIEQTNAKIEAVAQRVATVSQSARVVLVRARAAVDSVGKQSAKLDPDPVKNQFAAAAIRSLIRQEVGPNIDAVGERLLTFSDAAIAVAALLEGFQDLPLGLDADKLKQAKDYTVDLSTGLHKLQGLLGDDKTTTQHDVAAAANEVDRVLQKCQAIVADVQTDLDRTRAELASLKTRTFEWLTPAAIGLTCLCAWFVLAQMSLFVHAWGWVRGRSCA